MKCKNIAIYRYTWPGEQESFVCSDHYMKLTAIANAIGLPLQLIPLDTNIEKIQCCQEVKE